ncbi:MAG: hypothetical protein ACRC67_01420 [Inquilinus sp.]|uniref:hypothetical protein n=1 Tax=Inquilinus sp. TaxID=1932117 RepID=UPI003F3F052D
MDLTSNRLAVVGIAWAVCITVWIAAVAWRVTRARQQRRLEKAALRNHEAAPERDAQARADHQELITTIRELQGQIADLRRDGVRPTLSPGNDRRSGGAE